MRAAAADRGAKDEENFGSSVTGRPNVEWAVAPQGSCRAARPAKERIRRGRRLCGRRRLGREVDEVACGGYVDHLLGKRQAVVMESRRQS